MFLHRPQSLSRRSSHLFAVLFSFACAIAACFGPNPASAQTTFRGFTLDSSITDAQMDGVAAFKANVVYYFLNPNEISVAMTHDDYLANLDLALQRLDEVLDGFGQRGIKVAVDLAGPPGAFYDRKTPALQRVFTDVWAQQTLIDAWKVIAARYVGNSAVWGYNLLNEPCQRSVKPGLLPWKSLSVLVAQAVRGIDPDVRLIVQPPYGNPNHFSMIAPLTGLGTVEYSFNFYYPYKFTHQGLYGIPLKMVYRPTITSRNKLLSVVRPALRFRKKAGAARMYVAEFSAVRWAPKGSAVKYLADVIKMFESLGLDWTYHAYAGVDNSPSFAYPWSVLYDSNPNSTAPADQETDRALLLASYFNKNQ
jgi:hypothetical protein